MARTATLLTMATIKQTAILLLLAGLALTYGCLAAGLKRTPLDKWQTHEFPAIGLRITLPAKAQLVGILGERTGEGAEGSWTTLKFYLHSVSSGQFLAEPMYLVHFRFERLNPQQYKAFRKGSHSLSYYWIWQGHHDREYDRTESFGWQDMGREVLGWRRDYHCSNGDIVVAGVEYILVDGNVASRAEDIAAIERVLGSVAEIQSAQ